MPTSKPRRSKRDPEVRQRLDRIRDLMKVRRQAAQRREIDIIESIKAYLLATGSINEGITARDHRINELRKQIEYIETEHASEVSQLRGQQARAVASIRDLGESEDGIAELLDLTSKQARQYLAVARATHRPTVETGKQGQLPSSKPDQTPDVASEFASQAGSGEQADTGGQSLA
ncbi:hypothetical protein ACFWPX_03080 [Nocardia sp. NPDC058518]|uniref:hypothetical protein n=1 Tax=Nocardia sp. NPDC058518 TaxID=3346534 RepID=UPI00366887C9